MICRLACLSKYVILANFVLYVCVGLGWRSAGEGSLGLGTLLRWRLVSGEGQGPWEQWQKKNWTGSVNVAYGWRYRKPKAWARREVLSKHISSSWNRSRESSRHKQVAEAEERTEEGNPGKACEAALGWEEKTQKANGGDKSIGKQKEKGGWESCQQ